jgi:branched-chain amino acid transport system substrate-binding protein
VPFFPDDPRPEVQKFVKAFVAKYKEQPDAYNGRAYDTFILLAAVMRKSGITRAAIKDGLATISGVPSVVFGKVTFDPKTRRVANPIVSRIKVENGKWVAWKKS